MNIIEHIRELITLNVQKLFSVDIAQLPAYVFNLNTAESKGQFGDISTNIPFILARNLKQNPQILAQTLSQAIVSPYIEKVEVAGAGFINIYLTLEAIQELSKELIDQGKDFFKGNSNTISYDIEFVSANPTGPLHLGHGRGGIIGDVLGNILHFLGNKVTKEFYINDAGSQMQKLGESFKIRCEQLAGFPVTLPEDAYHGEYLVELAEQAKKEFGDTLAKKDNDFFITYARTHLLDAIKHTLKNYGIEYNEWFSETKLHKNHAIAHVVALLIEKKLIYEKDHALWFKATQFGDDKDRVIKKTTGEFTYVAADIAYLKDKIERGYDQLIMVLGQDHHSYVTRLKAIMEALGYNPNRLHVILYQLVTIKESGIALRMSKRKGRIVTLRDVIEEVGKDVARFFYLNKKADAHLEFDIDLALQQTDENPVYYIQYAYVRTVSILNKVDDSSLHDITVKDSKFIGESERNLIKKIASLKTLLSSISQNYQTHLLAYYAIELAQNFHSYYNAHKVIDKHNIDVSRGRLLTITLLKDTMKIVFDILGISAPEKM